MDYDQLINEAEKIFIQEFPNETCFERALFYSWACQLEECCKYCYMSTLPKEKRTKDRVRSFASLLAETILCREFGWKFGFLSGGIGVYGDDKILDLLKKIHEIINEKIWVNIGILQQDQIERFKPYIIGVVGTVEVLNPVLHEKICPSKPIEAAEKMFDIANKAGVECAMTLIVGLGETIDDFDLLKSFIEKHNITKIHIYGLNPQIGTEFENSEPPSAEYQAEWIARTRIAFPKIDIQCGIWKDRTDRVSLLLKAGANSVSKYPILKKFGSESAIDIENQAKIAGRKFIGTVTKGKTIDIDNILESLSFDEKLKLEIKVKLQEYLRAMGVK